MVSVQCYPVADVLLRYNHTKSAVNGPDLMAKLSAGVVQQNITLTMFTPASHDHPTG